MELTPENDFVVTQAFVSGTFDYARGKLYWKIDPRQSVQWNGLHAGKFAGTVDAKGYVSIQMRCGGRIRKLQVHRLIFCLHHGHLPEIVDHINGDPSDNRIENLRAAVPYQNSANRKARKDSSTGYLGVSRRRRDNSFEVQVLFAKKRHYIGRFKDIEEARIAAELARARIVGEWRREASINEVLHDFS